MFQVETHLNAWVRTGPLHNTYQEAQQYIAYLRNNGDTSRLRIQDIRCTATGSRHGACPSVQCMWSTDSHHNVPSLGHRFDCCER